MADKKKPGQKLTPVEQELIVQTYALLGNKSETARRLGMSLSTVRKYLDKVPPKELSRMRSKAQQELAEKVHTKTVEILDSIGPEDIKKASLMQKATSAAILIDKQAVVQRTSREMEAAASGQMMVSPEMVTDLLAAVQMRLNALRGLVPGLEVRSAEDAGRALQEVAQQTAEGGAPVEEADFEELDSEAPFDATPESKQDVA